MSKNEPPGPSSDCDDLALVQRVLAGDRRAFEPLVRRHERRVYRVALAILGNPEDAEESMQDTFVRALRHMDQFRSESRFTTWLTRIAVNEAVRRRGARKNTVPLSDAGSAAETPLPGRVALWQENPEKLYGRQELRAMVENAIHSLPEIYREVFVLRDLEEISADEAAEVLGITVPALKSRLLRARLMVRELLGAKLQQPRSLHAKIVHKTLDAGAAAAQRLLRAVGR